MFSFETVRNTQAAVLRASDDTLAKPRDLVSVGGSSQALPSPHHGFGRPWTQSTPTRLAGLLPGSPTSHSRPGTWSSSCSWCWSRSCCKCRSSRHTWNLRAEAGIRAVLAGLATHPLARHHAAARSSTPHGGGWVTGLSWGGDGGSPFTAPPPGLRAGPTGRCRGSLETLLRPPAGDLEGLEAPTVHPRETLHSGNTGRVLTCQLRSGPPSRDGGSSSKPPPGPTPDQVTVCPFLYPQLVKGSGRQPQRPP